MRELTTVGIKTMREKCSRCGGSGVYRWSTSFGLHEGVCFKCGGAREIARTVKPLITEPAQRRAMSGSPCGFQITFNPAKGRLILGLDDAGNVMVASVKFQSGLNPAPFVAELRNKATFANEVRALNGLPVLEVSVELGDLVEAAEQVRVAVEQTEERAKNAERERIQAVAAEPGNKFILDWLRPQAVRVTEHGGYFAGQNFIQGIFNELGFEGRRVSDLPGRALDILSDIYAKERSARRGTRKYDEAVEQFFARIGQKESVSA